MGDKDWAGKGFSKKNSESAGSKRVQLLRESLARARRQHKSAKKG